MSSLSSMAIKELEDACTKLNIKTTNKEKRQKPKLMQKLLAFARAHKKLLGNLWRSVSASDKAVSAPVKAGSPVKSGASTGSRKPSGGAAAKKADTVGPCICIA